jgi:DegV family protein with EDD domain
MIKIVTDSTALIPDKIVQDLDIKVIPLNVTIGDKMYQDGISINGQSLIQSINDNPKGPFPTTSQPSIGEFVEVYNDLTKNGDVVLSLHMTDLLSGTVHAAEQASEIADGDVKVINTHYIDQSMGYIVITAAKMANSGEYSRDEIVEAVENMIAHSDLQIGVSTLENLVKGGRISKATGILSKLMNLHVVFKLFPDDLKLQLKGRGKKVFNKWSEERLSSMESKKYAFIGISYTGNKEFAESLKERLHTMFPDTEILVQYTSSIVSVHTGNNAFALMTCEKWD